MTRFCLSRLLLLTVLFLAGLMPANSQVKTPDPLVEACAALDGYRHANILPYPETQEGEVIRLCGGVDHVAPQLARLSRDRSAETRLDAAAALGLRDTFLPYVSFAYPPFANEVQAMQAQQADLYRRRLKSYNQFAIPALTACVQDKDDGVRLAALQALEALTCYSEDAAWSSTVLPVSQAAAATDTVLHLPALRVLAYMPADVSSAASSLRLGLQGTTEEQNYALAALIHAGQTNRNVTLSAFLPELAFPSLAERRQAMSDISLAIIPLWTSDFITQYPLPNWNGDNRLSTHFEQVLFHLAPQAQKEQQAAAEKAQARLLAALVKAAADPDHLVHYGAATSLEQIANWACNGLCWSIIPNSAYDTRSEVEQALTQAAASLKVSDPLLAERLQKLSAGIVRGPGAVF